MDARVKVKFDSYPEDVSIALGEIRHLILAVAEECGLHGVEEGLKWGEPSYRVKGGSTIRFDWKPKSANQYAVYFNCQTTLIETFKELYGEVFTYAGNRALVFRRGDTVPTKELKHCIAMTLNYHKLKNLPLLGA